jgi:anti-sigma-K factor RskA
MTHENPCPRGVDAGAYVLHALEERDADVFAEHLEGCAACAAEVAHLQVAADVLPLSAPQMVAPPDLKGRIMQTVQAEADLLAAAGAGADRPPKAERRSRAGWLDALVRRPALVLACALALVAAGAGADALLRGDDDGAVATRTLQADVTAQGARVDLEVRGDRAALKLTGMRPPPAGRVYQVWLMREGSTTPEPTGTLFDVPADGSATIPIDESIDGVSQVLVTAEPRGGSQTPSGTPIIAAQTA